MIQSSYKKKANIDIMTVSLFFVWRRQTHVFIPSLLQDLFWSSEIVFVRERQPSLIYPMWLIIGLQCLQTVYLFQDKGIKERKALLLQVPHRDLSVTMRVGLDLFSEFGHVMLAN